MPTNLLRTYPRRMLLVLAALVTSMLLATACTSDSDSGITFPTPTVTKPAVEPERPTIGVELPDVERAALVAAFESIGYASTDAREGAAVAIADRTFPDAVPVIARAWVAITDQRRDVHELTSEQVHAILTGAVTDWSELGGTEQPPTAIGDFAGIDVENFKVWVVVPAAITTTGFQVQISRNLDNFAPTWYYGYSWVAIGTQP